MHNEFQFRSHQFYSNFHQALIRLGVGCNLTEKNNNVLLGYGYIYSELDVPEKKESTAFNEHFIYQQFNTNQYFGRVYLQHRYRIEERWISANFSLRFQYFLSLHIPINHATMSDKTWFAAAFDEIFLRNGEEPFGHNRLYGGIGYQVNSTWRFESGYMNFYTQLFNRNLFMLMCFYNF